MPIRALVAALGLLSAAVPARADDPPAPEKLALAVKLLANPRTDDGRRVQAAKLIGAAARPGPAAEAALCTGLLAPSAKLQAACDAGLRKHNPQVHAHVTTLARDHSNAAHFDALRALAAMGRDAKPALPVIAAHVRTAAAACVPLADLPIDLFAGQPGAVLVNPFLEKLGQLRPSAASSLIGQKLGGSTGSKSAKTCMLLTGAGAAALARIAPDDAELAYRAYTPLLKHPNNMVRYTALSALSLFGKSGAKCLKGVQNLKYDPNRAVRELAFKVAGDIENGTPGAALSAEPKP